MYLFSSVSFSIAQLDLLTLGEKKTWLHCKKKVIQSAKQVCGFWFLLFHFFTLNLLLFINWQPHMGSLEREGEDSKVQLRRCTKIDSAKNSGKNKQKAELKLDLLFWHRTLIFQFYLLASSLFLCIFNKPWVSSSPLHLLPWITSECDPQAESETTIRLLIRPFEKAGY